MRFNNLAKISHSHRYWLLLLFVGIAMEGVALFYQYRLDYAPCVLCIHVRLWLLGLIVVSLAGVLLARLPRVSALWHGLSGLLMVGMLERSWQLLGTERGWIFGSCNMDAGLPAWFALDEWFPAVFQVKEACGYTPELLFGVTMAEALLAFSVVMVLAEWLLMVSGLFVKRQYR